MDNLTAPSSPKQGEILSMPLTEWIVEIQEGLDPVTKSAISKVFRRIMRKTPSADARQQLDFGPFFKWFRDELFKRRIEEAGKQGRKAGRPETRGIETVGDLVNLVTIAETWNSTKEPWIWLAESALYNVNDLHQGEQYQQRIDFIVERLKEKGLIPRNLKKERCGDSEAM